MTFDHDSDRGRTATAVRVFSKGARLAAVAALLLTGAATSAQNFVSVVREPMWEGFVFPPLQARLEGGGLTELNQGLGHHSTTVAGPDAVGSPQFVKSYLAIGGGYQNLVLPVGSFLGAGSLPDVATAVFTSVVDDGRAVGTVSVTKNGKRRKIGFYFDASTGYELTYNGRQFLPTAMNDGGLVIGTVPNVRGGVLYDVATRQGVEVSHPVAAANERQTELSAISRRGEVVGKYYVGPGSNDYGYFVRTTDGQLVDFTWSRKTIVYGADGHRALKPDGTAVVIQEVFPTGVNSSREIVGYFTTGESCPQGRGVFDRAWFAWNWGVAGPPPWYKPGDRCVRPFYFRSGLFHLVGGGSEQGPLVPSCLSPEAGMRLTGLNDSGNYFGTCIHPSGAQSYIHGYWLGARPIADAIWKGSPSTPNPWRELDNNSATIAIIVDQNTGQLYQRHASGRIWLYTGVPHTGWQELDNNPATVNVVASGGQVFQMHNDGRIWRYTGVPYTGWQEIDNNPATVAIATGGGKLFQLHRDGRIWRYTDVPHTGWQQIDDNPATRAILVDGTNGQPYQLHENGRIWRFTGVPMTGWQELDNNPATRSIVASDGNLFQLHDGGAIWRFTGVPFTGWQMLDKNPSSTTIVASGSELYQIHKGGAIWRYTGRPLTGWTELNGDATSVAIAAGSGALYQLRSTGAILQRQSK